MQRLPYLLVPSHAFQLESVVESDALVPERELCPAVAKGTGQRDLLSHRVHDSVTLFRRHMDAPHYPRLGHRSDQHRSKPRLSYAAAGCTGTLGIALRLGTTVYCKPKMLVL